MERSFAHVCNTGGARRTQLRGVENVQKRYLITLAGRNLTVLMRALFGIGTPRSLQGLSTAIFAVIGTLVGGSLEAPGDPAPSPRVVPRSLPPLATQPLARDYPERRAAFFNGLLTERGLSAI